MKKIYLLLLFIVLSNCEIKPRSVNAYTKVTWTYREEMRNGMNYGIWWADGDGSNREDAIFVINMTKDALEIELLKKQLEQLNKQK